MEKSLYLPSEGLQGEEIPSHILWDDMEFESIQISYQFPLKIKEVYNSEFQDVQDSCLVIQEVELDGYLGLVFESCTVSTLEVRIPVKYTFHLSDGNVLEEVKEIRLFRPELKIEEIPESIKIDSDTGFIDGRIRVKNVGEGTLIINITTTDASPLKVDTPTHQKELMKRMGLDFRDEMQNLGKEYPQFNPLIDELLEWDERNFPELHSEERDRYMAFFKKLSNALTSNKEFLREFIGAYAKVLIKNVELLELARRFVKFYESLISRNILLINPFDEISYTDTSAEIELRISQTDRVMNIYEDVIIPKIEIFGSNEGNIPIYILFGWE